MQPAHALARTESRCHSDQCQGLPTIALCKDAFPNRRPFGLRINYSACHASPVLSRKSSSAITGFRSLGGREQHSPGYCAQMDLRFGTFDRRALAARALVFTRQRLRGQHRCHDRNVVVPRGYSKRFFCVPIGLYRGNLRPATALGIPARSALGGPAGMSPVRVIKASISPL